MKIFKTFFTGIWLIFDLLMFMAAVVTITVTLFTQVSILAGGIALTVSFIAAGFVSELIGTKKGGD